MDRNFWHRRWEQNDIAFHESEANALLVKWFGELSLAEGSRVFLPLCGKTSAIPWLLSRGYRVVGAELSKIAIDQLFAELGWEPTLSTIGSLDHYSAPNIDIFAGDLFDLSKEVLGPVDAVYDRAALVALPENMRTRYAAHLMEITDRAPQLLICYEYDQSVTAGPPFSVSEKEVREHYGPHYQATLLASVEVPGGLRGKVAAKEDVWVLRNE